MNKKDDKIKSFLYQCMSCAFKLESENAPFQCPHCKSDTAFAKVSNFGFF